MKKIILSLFLVLVLATVGYAYSVDGALDKIDWNSIEDGTIVLLTQQSDFSLLAYFNLPSLAGWKAFVPSQYELCKFTKHYDYEVNTIGMGYKSLFVFKEVERRDYPLPKACKKMPSNLLIALKGLKIRQPSCFSLSGTSGGSGGDDDCNECGDLCCDDDQDCCEYSEMEARGRDGGGEDTQYECCDEDESCARYYGCCPNWCEIGDGWCYCGED